MRRSLGGSVHSWPDEFLHQIHAAPRIGADADSDFRELRVQDIFLVQWAVHQHLVRCFHIRADSDILARIRKIDADRRHSLEWIFAVGINMGKKPPFIHVERVISRQFG